MSLSEKEKTAMTTYSTAERSVRICGYDFEGPFLNSGTLKEQPGVYVILDKRSDNKWYVLDVGESEAIRTRVENHDRSECWARNRKGRLGCAVLYTPGWTNSQRRQLEKKIRDKYDPNCGSR